MKNLLPIMLVVFLEACSLPGGQIPPDHFYRLPNATPVKNAPAISSLNVTAEGIYNERALLFVEQSQPLELQRYHYHFWAQTPATLVQQYLGACWQVNEPTKENGKSMAVEIRAFERQVQTGQAQAVVKLFINQREYSASVTASSMALHDTATAFGAAMQQICEAAAAHP